MIGALTRQTLRALLRAPLSQAITISLIAASSSLLAVSLTLMLNLDRLSQRWEGGGELLVVLNADLAEARYNELKRQILAFEQVSAVTLKTPRDAQREMSEALGTDQLELAGALEALPGTLELSVHDPSDAQALGELRAKILDQQGVLELMSVTDGKGLIAQLYTLRQALKGWLWLLALWVGASVAFVITQLVRLTLYQRQRELDIWIAVGASELLILGPLMIESATQTALGAWLALELVSGALVQLNMTGESTLSLLNLELSTLPDTAQWLFILSAALLGALSSLRVARASLRAQG